MAQPVTPLGKRRLALLRILRRYDGIPYTVSVLASRLGQTPESIRTHLQFLASLNLVQRTNYRRWASLPLPGGFDLSSLDSKRS